MRLPTLSGAAAAGAVRGLSGSSRALFLLGVGRPLLVVCRGDEEAGRLHGDLRFFAEALGARPPVLVPPPESRLGAARLEACSRIADGAAALVVAGPEAARGRLPDPRRLAAGAVELAVGGDVDAAFVTELLAEMGYRRVGVVADAGEFAVRRGRLDVFPAAGAHPVRVDHDSGRVTAIHAFDVGSQRSFRDEPGVRLLPALEPPSAPPLLEALAGRLLVADGAFGPDAAALPAPAIVIEEPSPLPGRPAPAGGGGPVVGFGLTVRERRAAGEGLAVLGPRLIERSMRGPVLVAAETLGEAERLRDLLAAAGLDAPILRPAGVAAHAGTLALVHGRLSAGFHEPASGFLALTSAELFGPRPPARAPAASRVGALIASLDDLAPGDYVVHVEHGIGRFVATERAHDQDFLRLEYAAGGRLLVPLERIDLLRRHHARGAARPRLDAIGGGAWRETKRRARETVREMAAALLRQAAEREAAPGFAFSPDDERHREFADAFGFEPTADQRASWEGIRAAMERPRPMDWLLCGDVGYGKTEVAMRAAFKAVADGKQVAVVAPTTLLAEQHADVFAARFAPFGVGIDALTRFTASDEARAVLARLAAGEAAIVVGTHRLLAADVVFADLGLVIVDEEQRFGVEHKERIRGLRRGVDILTLTATPIPRTLAMALAGVRGISALETPPEERLAARTVVARFDSAVVREALEREFARGGQAFFVHNRIESIARVAVWLQRLLPGRRVGVAHARMDGAALEQVMRRFRAGDVDVLLATAIVGAGLDVPRANTLVVDRADRFGLADLYQLKGRVGRGDRRAYAYFLVPDRDRITDEARERLEALEEHSCLGAGFRLALRDLEIRGCGDLLGAEQSGHIAAVGFDLYREMLAEAVAELRGEAPAPAVEPVVELRLDARLPAAWVDEPALRFSVLRRIAAARDAGAVTDLRRELADRFGAPPREAAHLLDLAELRVFCRAAGVARVEETADRRYRVVFAAGDAPPPAAGAALAAGGACRVAPLAGAALELDCAKRSWPEILRAFGRLAALAAGGKR